MQQLYSETSNLCGPHVTQFPVISARRWSGTEQIWSRKLIQKKYGPLHRSGVLQYQSHFFFSMAGIYELIYFLYDENMIFKNGVDAPPYSDIHFREHSSASTNVGPCTPAPQRVNVRTVLGQCCWSREESCARFK